MCVDLDTFLVTVYTLVDDLYQAEVAAQKPAAVGRPPRLSDSEVLTLLVAGQWLGNAERALYRHAAQHWRAYFPHLGDRSSFNRRARTLTGVLLRLIPLLARDVGASAAVYEVIDGVPVPLMRRCRGVKHRLFGEEAGIGRGGSDHDWYYGCELLVAVADVGAVTGFVLGPPATDDRWLAEALLCWRQDPTDQPWRPADLPPSHHPGGGRVGPTGPIWPRDAAGIPSGAPYAADGGFHGACWTAHWRTDYGATVLTPRDLSPDRHAPVRRQFAGWRQVIETVNDLLTETFHLAFPRARSPRGLLTRVAAKLAALNLGLLLNRHFARPPFALASLLP
jgi:hypothetical protein